MMTYGLIVIVKSRGVMAIGPTYRVPKPAILIRSWVASGELKRPYLRQKCCKGGTVNPKVGGSSPPRPI